MTRVRFPVAEFSVPFFVARARTLQLFSIEVVEGSWCSGITSALHAEGPGFKSRRIHFCFLLFVQSAYYKRAVVGIEPTTSPTLRENHTTRPNSLAAPYIKLLFLARQTRSPVCTAKWAWGSAVRIEALIAQLVRA